MIKKIISSIRQAIVGKQRNIHPTAFVENSVSLSVGVSIGANVKIGHYTYINGHTQVSSGEIGCYCSIGSFCEIGPDSHPINWVSTSPYYYRNYSTSKTSSYREPRTAPIIGHDVWIGSHVVVLRGVVIGQGAVLGAGAIVTKDVAPYEIVTGVPARHLKYRFDKSTIDMLMNMNIYEHEYPKKISTILANEKENFSKFLTL